MTSPQAPAGPSAPTPAGPTPAESEKFARTSGRLTVSDYIPKTFHDGAAKAGKCEWTSHVAPNLSASEMGALAWVLVEAMMAVRFGPATQLLTTWRDHTLAGTKIPAPLDLTVASFIEPVFGLPTAPKSITHLEGHVGEWLWHILTKDNAAVHLQPDPKGDVTDAGGDGFSVYEAASGDLRFRLWESKKNTGTGSLSTSLSKAYAQIADKGQRYVAKIVGSISSASGVSPEVMHLMTEVPLAWTEGSELVGAGVTLATHQALPSKPFKNMSSKLPGLDKPGQLRGLITSIGKYDEFALTVRRYAWTAL